MPAETYRFTERSFGNLARAGIAPFDVSVALESRPRIRRHIGGALQMVGRDRNGRWLAVALIEHADDEYEVHGAGTSNRTRSRPSNATRGRSEL